MPPPDACVPSGSSFGRDPYAPAPRRWWSRPSSLLTAGHTTAGAAWLATLCLLIAYRLMTGINEGGERGVGFFMAFFIVGLPAFCVALVLIPVALGLLLAVVTPLALAWLGENQPDRSRVLWSLGHALVACAVPVVLLVDAVLHGR